MEDASSEVLLVIPNTLKARTDLIHRIQNYLTHKFQVYSGRDTNGREYDTIEEMWHYEGFLKGEDDNDNASRWYDKSHTYWEKEENVQATIDGMLGGFAVLSERDIAASHSFLRNVIACRPLLNTKITNGDSSRSCECGAGIGRLTKGLLLPFGFQNCDLVETSPRLVHAAPEYIGEHFEKCTFICKGLQDFNPKPKTYDVIWIQWVIAYLTDWDLVNFLNRMGNALKEGGVIIIKDNTCSNLAFTADKDDCDITRSFQYLRAIILESGLRVLSNDGDDMIHWQDDFPDDIWPVPMIALTM
jgi:protein N-terminal methyltransferase